MSKGLLRSLSRADAALAPMTKIREEISFALSLEESANRFAAGQIGQFPVEGYTLIHGGVAHLRFDGSATYLMDTSDPLLEGDWEGDFAIGTSRATSVSLNASMTNVFPSTAIPAASGGIANMVGRSATQSIVDATSIDTVLWFNLVVDSAGITDASTIHVTGYVDLVVSVLGDN